MHCKSKRHETKPMHPFSSRAFPRDQEGDLKHPSSLILCLESNLKMAQLFFMLHKAFTLFWTKHKPHSSICPHLQKGIIFSFELFGLKHRLDHVPWASSLVGTSPAFKYATICASLCMFKTPLPSYSMFSL